MQRLVVVGSGDVARRAFPWLVRHYRVFAVARSESKVVELRRQGITPIRADLDQAKTLKRLAGLATLVLHSAPPPDTGTRDRRTQRLVAALARRGSLPRRLIYVSTSGVYGDCAGALVTEERAAHPQTARAARRVDAERVVRAFGRRCKVSVSLLRAPGIYATDRLPLERLRRGDPVLRAAEDVFTNHIHADDLAAIVCRALSRGRPGRAYNANDDSALKMGDYFDLVADAVGLPRAPRVSRDEAGRRLAKATLSFMGESRRLVNRRVKQELRVRLKYPSVAEGVAAARAMARESG